MKVYVHGDGHLAEITTVHIRSIGYGCYVAHEADILWACEDVNDIHHLPYVIDNIRHLVHANPNAVALISSQLPAGTIRSLESEFPMTRFACCPENFKATDNASAYLTQERFVIGVRHMEDMRLLRQLFSFARNVIFMRIESAEMVKHTINAYLGMCIAFINEIRDICDDVGADIQEVEDGLISDKRASPNAPLLAGEPFGGGHIDRDLNYLREIHRTPLIEAIYESNHSRRR